MDSGGAAQRVVKGAYAVVIALAETSPTAEAIAKELEGQGFRVLAVAAGAPEAMKLVGLIALSDPPRADSAALVKELQALGVRTVMVTGDAPATAAIVARSVGLDGAIFPPGPIPDAIRPEDYAVFAGVLPEDKFKLVKAYQNGGRTVGMCGDGANDAPALRQAQIGIAVSTATEVAKAAAGMVLTEPGLAGIVASVKQGRVIFQRILTYTLNSLNKKIVQVLFIAAGLVMTGQAILTPLLMALIMIIGDILGMSLTTDNVRPSPLPNVWRIGNLTIAGAVMGLGQLAFCVSALAVGARLAGFDIDRLRTLAFVIIVFGNQATTYNNRERRRIWSSRPSLWLAASSCVDILIAATLALTGIAMAPLPLVAVVGDVCRRRRFRLRHGLREGSRFPPPCDRLAREPDGRSRLRLSDRPRPAVVLMKSLGIDLGERVEGIPRRARLDLFARHVELDVAVEPFDRFHRQRRNQHALAKPPIPRVDDEIVDAPVGVVDHEILDMADFAVGGVNAVAGNFIDAAHVRVGPVQTGALAMRLAGAQTQAEIGRRHIGPSDRSGRLAEIGTAPKRVPPVVSVEPVLHLLRHRLVLSQFRALFDLSLRQRHGKSLLLQVGEQDGRRMDQHLAARQPSSAIDDQPAHSPRRVVEQEIDDSSDPAVARLDSEALQG